MNDSHIPGHGVDADPARRPGVPQLWTPHPQPHAVYPPPRQQTDIKQPMHGRPDKTYPPVWGTAQPPRGLSGLLRKTAYAWPDHLPKHWLLLLLADRVDVTEHRLRRGLPALAALAGGYFIGRSVVRRLA
jgi:hypothetical protein